MIEKSSEKVAKFLYLQARIGAGRGRGCQLAFMAAKVEGEVERVQEVGGKGNPVTIVSMAGR